MFTSVRKSDFSSVNYEIGQKVESCRLMQGYNQIELASKIGSTYQEINNYELGYSPIPIEELYTIAGALSVSVTDLLPEPTELRENSWYEDEDEENTLTNENIYRN